MANDKPTSFSAARRWGIFFSVIISIVAVVALVAMVNYLAVRYYTRFPLSRQTEVNLSSQTHFLLKTITNEVKITVYYDKTDPLYPNVVAWLDEYHLANPKITVSTVDFRRDVAMAQQVKAKYKLGSTEDKNLVIFDCNGRYKIVPEGLLADYSLTEVSSENEKQREFERTLKGFNGEMRFTPALLNVVNTKQRKAYFLEDNGEASIEAEGKEGYSKLAEVLEQNGITNAVLKLRGTNTVPSDCNLLVIAGPQKVLPENELAKIRQYLQQGGRLFVLFQYSTFFNHIKTGLEDILADWNIDVGMNVVSDPDNTAEGGALVVEKWNPNHPISSPMLMAKSTLDLVMPRSIQILDRNKTGPESPKVEELATTG
ncbi:MAG TPA: Gldg family protein, partial [Verrucomicrobiae bacterium]|nr:Gldg family protein [Verrucomicrobiae bacterium]